jgi:hypothetical protein
MYNAVQYEVNFYGAFFGTPSKRKGTGIFYDVFAPQLNNDLKKRASSLTYCNGLTYLK